MAMPSGVGVAAVAELIRVTRINRLASDNEALDRISPICNCF